MYKIIVIVGCIIILQSCSNNTTSSPTSSTLVKAKVGSSYTFQHYLVDSLGNVINPRDTIFNKIIKTGITFMGKSDVLQLYSTYSNNPKNDTTYMAYESNNNISMLYSMPDYYINGIWVTVPTSKTDVLVSKGSGSVSIGGVKTNSDVTVTTMYLSDEKLVVKAETLSVVKVQMTSELHKKSDNGNEDSITIVAYALVAPTIGMVAKTYTDAMTLPNTGFKIPGSQTSLIDYVLVK